MADCYDEFKSSLKSYVKYKFFNNPVEVPFEKLKCDELSSELLMHNRFKNFCYMLSINIKNVCNSLEVNQRLQENCDFLKYWLYDALIKIKFLKDEENISKSSIMDKISKLWDASNYNQKCNLTIHNMTTTEFMHMKELYDYSENYLAIEENQTIHSEQQCRKEYCSYIKKVDDVYKLVKSACNPKNDKVYCEILSKIPENKIPSVFLNGYKCTNDEIIEGYIKDDNIFTTTLLDSAFEDTDITSVQQEPGNTFPQPISDQGENSPEGSSSNSSVKVGLSTFGMSLVPLFLIYKFTPGGNFLRRIINQKIGTNYNTGEIPSGDWFSISRAHQNDIQTNREFNVLYQNMEKK
ncbi:VIR protein [Plasmodium vivax]|uniref:VIR protein n=1 Tax=Plasmodium vivax TaxID=5855 RepID=A0A1G4EAA2_PLAVI|nr:VIR protein [Plasmodium vivax]